MPVQFNPSTGNLDFVTASLPIGTTLGTVAAGNDPRLQTIVTPASFGPLGVSVAGDTAAFQSAHDSLPSTGGVIAVPPGVFRPFGVNISKPVIMRGSGIAGGALVTSNPTGWMFNVSSAGCKFADLSFQNTSTATAGGFITEVANSSGTILDSCLFTGGWIQVQLQNGDARHVINNSCQEFRCYGVDLGDDAVPDSGDDVFIGNVFASSSCAAGITSACIHWPSASGLKLIGNKLLGSGVAGSPTHGLWADLKYGPGQMNDLVMSGNSVENVLDSGVCVTVDGTHNNTGQGLNTIEITGANQFFNCGAAAITLFRYPTGTTATPSSNRIHIGGAVIHQCPIGIYAGPCTNLQIESDILYGTGVPRAVVVDPATSGYIAAQTRADNGYLFECVDNTTAHAPATPSANLRVVIAYKAAPQVASTSPQVLCRAVVPVFTGGKIKATSSGTFPGVGAFLQVAERGYTRAGGGVVPTTIGTDTSIGVAASQTPIAFDVSTASGEIRLTQSTTVSAFYSCLTVEVEGTLTSFKVGP